MATEPTPSLWPNPPGGYETWEITYPWDIEDWEIECSVHMDSAEVVTIEQTDNGAGGFAWDEGLNKSGMGATTMLQGDRAYVPDTGWITDGLCISTKRAD